MKTGKTHEPTRSPSSFDASFHAGKKSNVQSSRAHKAEDSRPTHRAAGSSSSVFEEGSSKLARSLANGMSALQIPADLTEAMTDLVAGDRGDDARAGGQLHSTASIGNLQRDVEAQRTAPGQPVSNSDSSSSVQAADGQPAPQDSVISASARAASVLAAMVEKAPFGAIAIGAVSNMADFLAPVVVEGIKDPLARSAAAAGFSGVFLGLTASVTTALGNDIGRLITENRITEKAPEGEVSRGSQLLSAVKNQTVPAFLGFATSFAAAAALDAESGKLGETEPNTETVFLKMARATVGAVGVGLWQEYSKTLSSDHTLTKSDATRVFDNTRALGESIKKNVTSLPQALSAYTRPTEPGKGTEFGNVLGAAFGFATFAAIFGAVHAALQSTYGEETGERMSEKDVQAAIATAAGVAGFVIADQLARNIYANVMPARGVTAESTPEVLDADEGDIEVPVIQSFRTERGAV